MSRKLWKNYHGPKTTTLMWVWVCVCVFSIWIAVMYVENLLEVATQTVGWGKTRIIDPTTSYTRFTYNVSCIQCGFTYPTSVCVCVCVFPAQAVILLFYSSSMDFICLFLSFRLIVISQFQSVVLFCFCFVYGMCYVFHWNPHHCIFVDTRQPSTSFYELARRKRTTTKPTKKSIQLAWFAMINVFN